MNGINSSGVSPLLSKFWEELRRRAPSIISRNSKAVFNPKSKTYTLKVLNKNFIIKPVQNEITILEKPHARPDFMWHLLLLNYLLNANDIPLTNRLVSEQEFKGGIFFFRGLHAFDFSSLEGRYARDKQTFIKTGQALGGAPKVIGDAAIELYPLPRVPLIYTLWLKNREFPARIKVLFDESAENHLPLDMIWSLVNLINREILETHC